MRIGITGASGHVGNVLCRLLIDQGHTVNALYHADQTALQNLNVQLFKGNVLEPESLKPFVKGCDVIINSAAIISIHGDPTGIVFKTNTEGPKNVLEAAIQAGVKKIIHLSSTHAVLEEPLDTPFQEERPYKTAQYFAYDYSKATGEQIMLEAFRSNKIEGCVVRPSSVIGLFDYKPSEIGKALLDFYERKIPMLPPGGYNFIDIRDISQSIINSIEKGRNGEIYLLSGDYYTLKEFAAIVTKASGIKTPKTVMPFWFLKGILPFVKIYGKLKKAAPIFTIEAITALKLGHPHMVNDKAKKELNHVCRPLEETIRDFYDWQKKRGTIK
ncbi:MAG: NAD-dependent epimerase/dehydratase family protein [Crocinitomix sp.]|nr:NAD-dependent epimerase/dehydratase family protein [Crocinitomix sp.]